MTSTILSLLRIPPDYARNAWRGFIQWRFQEDRPARIVQGVVLDRNYVLLAVRAELRGWELPGGSPDPQESFEVALVREILEETGVETEVIELVGEYERTGFRPHVAHVYRCRLLRGSPRISRETSHVAWFPIDKLPETMFPWFRTPLSDALRESTGVRRREHQGLGAILAGAKIDIKMRIKANNSYQ